MPMPTGPKALRQTRTSRTTRTSDRGGIRKASASSTKLDLDGDLDMGTIGGAGRGRQTGRVPPPGPAANRAKDKSIAHREARPLRIRSSRQWVNPETMHKAVLRGMGSDAVGRGGKADIRASKMLEEAARSSKIQENRWSNRENIDRIAVRGWQRSTAASTHDRGIKKLVGFLERKATPNSPDGESVRIRKSQIEGDTMFIFVKKEDTPKLLRLDNFEFLGSNLSIELREVPAARDGNGSVTSEDGVDLKRKMIAMLNRRYIAEVKLLDLSQLGNDPDMVNTGMFTAAGSTKSKFFPALMVVCDLVFSSAQQKKDAVASVTLANNSLIDVSSVTALSQTFPALKNLDLSNNNIKDLDALQAWRWKFRHLEHLVLTGNPVETNIPTYAADITKWYPTLRNLNNIPVRSEEEVKAALKGKLPISTLVPSFRDEASIGENFIKQFFPMYDTNRAALADGFYDAQSTFSLSINTSAPRSQDSSITKVKGWDDYIKKSRNLVKLNHTAAQMARLCTGTDNIRTAWSSLPPTHHPDLLAEPQKWCIECHSIPGLPDLTGQSPSGVGGLIITVHGEFAELDQSNNEPMTIRSFDRTFILGPGTGVGGVRVANDILALRAYGGSTAWVPEAAESSDSQVVQPSLPTLAAVPEGFGVSGPGKSEEQVQKEIMALELSKVTGMTLQYSGMCLEQSGWNLQGAAVTFEQAKANLPSEAFMLR